MVGLSAGGNFFGVGCLVLVGGCFLGVARGLGAGGGVPCLLEFGECAFEGVAVAFVLGGGLVPVLDGFGDGGFDDVVLGFGEFGGDFALAVAHLGVGNLCV